MTGNRSKILADDEKSLVEVRRKSAEMLGFWRISVPWGLSGRHIGHVGDQML